MSYNSSKAGPELQALLASLEAPAQKPLWQLSKEARERRKAETGFATRQGNQRVKRAMAKAAKEMSA